MGILRTDRVSGLGGANAIKGSTKFSSNRLLEVHGAESNEDFRLSNGSFTIEFWAYIADTSNSTFVGLFENNPARRSWQFEARSNQGLRFEWWTDGSSGSNLTASTGSFIRERWQHFAVVRNGTALNIYVDGTSVANTTTSDTFYENTIEPLSIGGIFQSGALTQDITGFISNLRIIKGEAIYTANFTPPTNELTITSNTVVLACQSPGNILQEATGKTIVATTTSTNDAPPEASHFTPNSPVGFSTTTDVGTQFGSTFDGVTTFDSQAYFVPPGGNTRERNRGRAIIAGGTNGGGWGTKLSTISFIQIQSGGITQGFGELSAARTDVSSVSSSTRAVFGGGSVGATSNDAVNILEFITISTSSIATDFGDLIDLRRPKGGVSNNIRGLFGGGNISPSNKSEIDHVVIATAGNATDFGDLLVSGTPNEGSSNSTRGVWMGGGWGVQIEIVTIASTGSSTDFGNLGNNRGNAAGASSTTRALCAGGGSADTDITFIEFATLGNDSVFGDLTQGRRTQHGTSNSLRGIFCGGYTPDYNIIDAVTIATTGDAVDFGDLTTATREPDACSDSHGGVA